MNIISTRGYTDEHHCTPICDYGYFLELLSSIDDWIDYRKKKSIQRVKLSLKVGEVKVLLDSEADIDMRTIDIQIASIPFFLLNDSD